MPGDAPDLGTIYMTPLLTRTPMGYLTVGKKTILEPVRMYRRRTTLMTTVQIMVRSTYVGTDPNDESDFFHVNQVHGTNHEVTVIWAPVANGRSYKAEYSDDLTAANWQHGGGPWETGTGQNDMQWIDTTVTGQFGRCYRVRLAPP